MAHYLSESDTRSKFIDPALYSCGWTEEHIRREVTAGAIEVWRGKAKQRPQGRVDYVLRIKITRESQPVAVAIIEAKAEHLPPTHGLEQAKLYAQCKRLNVPFVFASNGHMFVEYDRFTGKTSDPRPITEFPPPDELRRRYEVGMGFSLASEPAKPLLTRYSGGEATRRYYQDAAIRAVFEKVARGEKRALLSLATGSGKTFIAVNLLKRIADAGQLRRALFICDRDELRTQGLGAFQNVFGSDAAEVTGKDAQKNARILVATYQTLDIDGDGGQASFFLKHYPENYFSHIIIDECHRSAWGKWSTVLTRNEMAIQIGLTATPRKIAVKEETPESLSDEKITADNYKWFGEPVYEYDMAQGIEDGYLAACEIHRFDIFHDEKTVTERDVGVDKRDLHGKSLSDADTGVNITPADAKDHYEAPSLDARLVMPDRVEAMCKDLFSHLLATGGPEQKTIIFCARDRHADAVATTMNNLYADWCNTLKKTRAEPYAFKCTSESGGNDFLPELRGSSRRYFVATTVDLLTTGVDVPAVRNIVFFKYVKSPIAFYQMVGRGTRLHPPEGKLMFRVFDYTNASRLFGEEFVSKHRAEKEEKPEENEEEQKKERTVRVEGFEVRVTDAGRYLITDVDGKAMPVTVEEYKEKLSASLIEEAPTIEHFREIWVKPQHRRELIEHLPDAGRSAFLIQDLEEMSNFDLYDVLAELAYGLAPKTRQERADAFAYKQAKWLRDMPAETSTTLRAIAAQFVRAGTEGLESREIFSTPEVHAAGGISALRSLGKPADVLMETKSRMFAA